MKKLIFLFSIGFSMLIIFNSLRVSFMFMSYKLDPIGFIENYCVNKDKPELQCHGKCHLKKVTQPKEDEKGLIKILDFEVLFFSPSPILYQLNTSFFNSKKKVFSYLNYYSFHFKFFSFHPPEMVF